ncbi:hypothetical protein GEV33_014854 [Tenebrio molitor]|uniref:Secreted protein n=1 Tax=Tenebrio molitor TaxID=7067 RepID=A0A8J6L4F2_TENMO|nr:hypothetical protein GEV33_014856 [Tenebrio molitor]KAH0807937.1 hypothetical protein GEV33_014854 [Tenebrio molitor]
MAPFSTSFRLLLLISQGLVQRVGVLFGLAERRFPSSKVRRAMHSKYCQNLFILRGGSEGLIWIEMNLVLGVVASEWVFRKSAFDASLIQSTFCRFSSSMSAPRNVEKVLFLQRISLEKLEKSL